MAETTTTRIDTSTLERWLSDGTAVRVLDVRTPAKLESVHIPGAYNVPLDTLGEHAEDIGHHVESPVV